MDAYHVKFLFTDIYMHLNSDEKTSDYAQKQDLLGNEQITTFVQGQRRIFGYECPTF